MCTRSVWFLRKGRPPISTLFPYPTLFRSSRRRHTKLSCDWSSDVCSSDRSEEHTSELQSHDNLVCRLIDRKSTRLNSSHTIISYAVFCLKKKKKHLTSRHTRNADGARCLYHHTQDVI